MSKIKKRRATRKNWKEKGNWEGFIRENPHSNWEFVILVSSLSFLTKTKAKRRTVSKIRAMDHRMEIFIYLMLVQF